MEIFVYLLKPMALFSSFPFGFLVAVITLFMFHLMVFKLWQRKVALVMVSYVLLILYIMYELAVNSNSERGVQIRVDLFFWAPVVYWALFFIVKDVYINKKKVNNKAEHTV